jgi:NADH:ubiquinone oxidoreductase subunit 4 (subunit M)
MVLAGVLLKLGGIGLIRVLLLFSNNLHCLLSYSITSLVLVTVVCCYQSDIKRLIAFSSVRHMIALPPLIILGTNSSVTSALLIMLIHGMSSPLLFRLVGFVYSSISTRQLVFLRGCIIVYPLLRFVCILGFLYSLSAPPFPSFVREVIFIACSIFLTSYFVPSLLVFCFLSLLYNLN